MEIDKALAGLEARNKMDEKPFLELDLSDIDEHAIPEVAKLTKADFDVDSVISAAGELKYLNQIKKVIGQQVAQPEEDFVRFFASRVYDGVITQRVRDQFAELTVKALRQFLNDKINDRLKTVLASGSDSPQVRAAQKTRDADIEDEDEHKVVTTIEELEGYHRVRAILREVVDVDRIVSRDTQSYFGVLLDDNKRKPLCRLHFNRTQKYLGLFDADKKETRHPIKRLDDIFQFAAHLKTTAGLYD
ncbi:hypothetical protein [Marinobacterium rhizophilum]|uniref:hypothetical protein n=1 Tax=Marinobacterium rhizophilum TaxID=420402 RepID=UPI00036CE154|nr:hypothetical protein [Marinobacterium rhizophilum]